MEEQAKYEVKVDDKRINHDNVPAVQDSSPNAVIMMAMQKNYSPEFIEKMMGLQERFEANEARKAYHLAMSEFKADPPKIMKDKKVGYDHKDGGGSTSYSYASLATVIEAISLGLSEHGLSAAWETNQEGNSIKVTCTITHKMGHCEKTSLSAASDTTGKKNAIQAVGSTISYLERYTILALTGLAAHDQDDDGNSAGAPDTTKYDEWVEAFNRATADKIPGLIKFWKENGKIIQKECGAAPAGKIYKMVVDAKKDMAAPEPGSLTE